ncbi:MAG: metalloregulator ArsR/SmtB family transcription factor [Candidatus Altiarchaeota archaeon]
MKKCSYELFFKALGNRTRLSVVSSLRGGPKNVSEICKKTGLEQSRISHSLALLDAWGLVASRREGKNVLYSLDDRFASPLLASIDSYMGEFGGDLCQCGILAGGGKCVRMGGKNG